ncbi:ABATE domain-containing protein [Streptomyces sp. WMMB 714]|uniref:CGNR zinc finger domain-containing protein n=1 Tax=Streptomyces sp. WMMB 714 TaxID=1286822 RepID=UPI0005F87A6A|nr:ABATE domain-containing protein [Streptomyces sp. WMMB 714]
MNAEATGLVMRSPDGTRYVFDPGALCLEFLTTGGPGDLAAFEVLHTPGDLAGWLARSRLGLAREDVRVTGSELAAAHRLRDALWGLARAAAHGQRREARHTAEVNRAASHPPPVPRMEEDGAVRGWQPPVAGRQALSAVARDAVELFTGPFASRVRECGAPDCRLVFVDVSRPGRRRWCAMERCGNRHKVRALRARRERDDARESDDRKEPGR